MKKRQLMLGLLLLVFTAGCTGCGQNTFEGQESKGTTEANRFKTSKNLDSGNYQSVLNDPSANPTDYAAAAMGMVGIDPVKVVQKVNDMSKSGKQNDLSAITSISIKPDNLQYLDLAGVKLAGLTKAPQLAAQAQSPALTGTDLNDNYFQRTFVDVVYIITAVAQVGVSHKAHIAGGFDPTDGISVDEGTALGNFIANKATSNQLDDLIVHTKYNADGSVDVAGDKTLVNAVSEKVAEVVSFIVPDDKLGVGTTSEIYKTLKTVTTSAGGLDYDGNGTVTGTDISDYLYCVIGSHTKGSSIPGTGRVCR